MKIVKRWFLTLIALLSVFAALGTPVHAQAPYNPDSFSSTTLPPWSVQDFLQPIEGVWYQILVGTYLDLLGIADPNYGQLFLAGGAYSSTPSAANAANDTTATQEIEQNIAQELQKFRNANSPQELPPTIITLAIIIPPQLTYRSVAINAWYHGWFMPLTISLAILMMIYQFFRAYAGVVGHTTNLERGLSKVAIPVVLGVGGALLSYVIFSMLVALVNAFTLDLLITSQASGVLAGVPPIFLLADPNNLLGDQSSLPTLAALGLYVTGAMSLVLACSIRLLIVNVTLLCAPLAMLALALDETRRYGLLWVHLFAAELFSIPFVALFLQLASLLLPPGATGSNLAADLGLGGAAFFSAAGIVIFLLVKAATTVEKSVTFLGSASAKAKSKGITEGVVKRANAMMRAARQQAAQR